MKTFWRFSFVKDIISDLNYIGMLFDYYNDKKHKQTFLTFGFTFLKHKYYVDIFLKGFHNDDY